MAGEVLTITDRAMPSLRVGDYAITASHTMKEVGATAATFATTVRTRVEAPGLILGVDDVHSVYPPPGSQGDFTTTLPHIVLSQATLPWSIPIAADKDAPWLALLIFGPDELIAGDERSPTKDIPGVVGTPPRSDANSREPDWSGGVWRKGDPCRYIRCRGSILRGIIPKLKEARLLAHVRSTTASNGQESQLFANIIANRVPERGKTSIAHLVSLRGFESLADGPSVTEDAVLFSLYSWIFFCSEGKRGFADVGAAAINNLTPSKKDRWLQASGANALSEATRADHGYSHIQWHSRYGEQSSELYHGPLTPGEVKGPDAPFISVDRALSARVDSDLNCFDLSFAAAWQLGQLLVAADGACLRDLLHWRRHHKRNLLRGAMRSGLQGIPAPSGALSKVFRSALKQHLSQPLGAETAGTGPMRGEQVAPWFERLPLPKQGLRALRGSDHPIPADNLDKDLLDRLGERLARMLLVSETGFAYLVPDALVAKAGGTANDCRLPEEALRLFRLDRHWLEAMLDGAVSVGEYDSEGRRQDALRRRVREAVCALAGVASSQQALPELHGFLLRSRLVTDWPGLQVMAWKQSGPLKMARQERLGDDILLCMFSAEWTKIDFLEPPQSLHFVIPPNAAQRGSVLDIAAMAGSASPSKFARDRIPTPARLTLDRAN